MQTYRAIICLLIAGLLFWNLYQQAEINALRPQITIREHWIYHVGLKHAKVPFGRIVAN